MAKIGQYPKFDAYTREVIEFLESIGVKTWNNKPIKFGRSLNIWDLSKGIELFRFEDQVYEINKQISDGGFVGVSARYVNVVAYGCGQNWKETRIKIRIELLDQYKILT